MPEKTYIEEHKRLIKLLDASNNKTLKNESQRQKKELKDYFKKKRVRSVD